MIWQKIGGLICKNPLYNYGISLNYRGRYGNYSTKWPVYELNETKTKLKLRSDLKFITEIESSGSVRTLELDEQFIATIPEEIKGKEPDLDVKQEFASQPEKWKLSDEEITNLVVFKVCYMDHSIEKNAYQRRCTFFRLVPTDLLHLQNILYVQVNVLQR